VSRSSEASATLVLGLGNVLLQDEGLGVRALERLTARYDMPAGVRAIDGGTLGLDLLPYLEDVRALIVIDAVRTGRPAGSLIRLVDQEIMPLLALKLSVHQVGLRELLGVSQLMGTHPPRVVLWGMEPGCMDWGLSLSPAVDTALDDLVEAVAGELRGKQRTEEKEGLY
jgi:hydrogenase maturation protease